MVAKTCTLAMVLGISWMGLWYTPDQLGHHYLRDQQYARAADAFEDPFWKGVAQFRGGDFKSAEQTFARIDSPRAAYNRGNALVMLGQYESAVDRYDRALSERPDWQDARQNRELAEIRFKRLDSPGGIQTGGELKADEIVFDDKANNRADEAEVAGGENLSSDEIQALWLRGVQTRPAQFLKSKFAYQNSRGSGDPSERDE